MSIFALLQSWIGGSRMGRSVDPRANRAHLEVMLLEDRMVPAFSITRFVPPTLTDVVPNALSGETDQNSEPNIAVNPSNSGQTFIGTFADGATNPYFATQNGRTFWVNFQNLPHNDESLAATSSGNVYAALLEFGAADSFTVMQSTAPNNPPNLVPISTFQGTDTPDQPWVEAATVAGQDHIYVTFNDLSLFGNGNTASIYYSTDGGATFQDQVIERNGSAVTGQDGPDVRSAVNGNTVYAAFSRWKLDEGGANFLADEVVVKDTNGGAGLNPFNALGANGVVAAPDIIDPNGTFLGSNRGDANIAIAVDPNDANRVALAYSTQAVAGGPTHVEVRLSTDGGQTWGTGPLFQTTSNSGEPAVAISANGTVGLLYESLVGNQREIHFVQSSDRFVSNIDRLVFGWQDNSPPPTFQPYTGDWYDINAVGNRFFATFSATNDLTTAVLPFGLQLQRNFSGVPGTPSFGLLDTDMVTPVTFSIDPFFFTLPSLEPNIKFYYPLRYTFNPATDLYTGYLTLTNPTTSTIGGPFYVFLPQLPPGVTLANPSGFDQTEPFIQVPGDLTPQGTLRVLIQLRNPLRVPLSTFYLGFPVEISSTP